MKKIICLFAFIFTGYTNAGLIDFEDLPSYTNYNNSSVFSGGFEIAHSGSFAIIWDNSGQGGTDFSGNGTTRLTSLNDSAITISNGSVFDLTQFSGGESWIQQPHTWATSISVTGFFSGGGSTSQVFDLDLFKDPVNGMETFFLNNNFVNLTSVSFSGLGGNPEFSIDNILVSSATIPEPISIALLGLGLVGIGFSRRKKAA